MRTSLLIIIPSILCFSQNTRYRYKHAVTRIGAPSIMIYVDIMYMCTVLSITAVL